MSGGDDTGVQSRFIARVVCGPGQANVLVRPPRNIEGVARQAALPFSCVCTLSPECRASRRATAASSGSRAALLAAIGLPEEPSDTALLGTVPFRASGKAKGFAPSASSSQEVLVPPGGAPAPPERVRCVHPHARGRRILLHLHDAS